MHTLLEGVCQKPLTLKSGTGLLWYKVIDCQTFPGQLCQLSWFPHQEPYLPLPHWCQLLSGNTVLHVLRIFNFGIEESG